MEHGEKMVKEHFSSLYDFLVYSSFLNRTYYLEDEIGETISGDLSRMIDLWKSYPEKKATIYLCSPGGDVFAGIALYDAILTSGFPINCIVQGYAASMASIILQAGARRLITRNSKIMIHEVSRLTTWLKHEETSKLLEEAAELKKVNDWCIDVLATRSKHSAEEILNVVKKTDKWFTAQEALEFGLVDEII